jgi:hypothetical protein
VTSPAILHGRYQRFCRLGCSAAAVRAGHPQPDETSTTKQTT